MPLAAKVSGIATSLHRRFRARECGDESVAPPQVLPPALDPVVEELVEVFRQRVQEKWSSPEHQAFLENDLNHIRRYALSLSWIPQGEGRVLDPACGAGHFGEVLRGQRGYTLETPGFFNLEKDSAPYPDATFDGVLLMEVLEHFTSDPMFALAELNRVLKPGGFLLLTTPNLASWVALHNLINHASPYLYGVFIRQGDTDRHNREYTVDEVGKLVTAAGFQVERLAGVVAYPSHDHLPAIPGVDPRDRGDTTFCLCRKSGPVVERYPDWLYTSW
ncbi:methyltransferase domain-containing protein [Singulisphaera sp. Ch08]|uniref:Methyltransferase domain-containing protein n=1 Tax=Singulisphaera sp. Ch08 TaxID=3120278 RepID=A0AAU7CPG9_9BACT